MLLFTDDMIFIQDTLQKMFMNLTKVPRKHDLRISDAKESKNYCFLYEISTNIVKICLVHYFKMLSYILTY